MNPRISRRHFLITGSGALGACFLPAWLLRRARDLEDSAGEVLIEPPDSASEVLYACSNGNGWQFTLGGQLDDFPPRPSWREYLTDYEGVDLDDPEAVAGWFERNHELPPGPDLDCLSDRIPSRIWELFIDGRYAIHDSPSARAYHYLSGLRLAHRTLDRQTADALGELQFHAGPMPGSNWHFVEAHDGIVLTALQHRLRELGEDVALVVS